MKDGRLQAGHEQGGSEMGQSPTGHRKSFRRCCNVRSPSAQPHSPLSLPSHSSQITPPNWPDGAQRGLRDGRIEGMLMWAERNN
ncbi:unnamed protein product [Protopolystoma xenopodis]|uniref:Uncharacterized protein n=1 Tax=Protopolystoma xenopodis TaxID=117903 RepID=A0A3S5BWZ3_9PLAT|nr:unnamed protein product [Protopolystoma xenopodis]